ncbi:MAG: hypothetical protein Q4G26_13815 [Paracoccus sp. (in: a-proteobacteria)]|nr:hypothetical protein [Paracoccus sp. (in: a-proteobacteria)]
MRESPETNEAAGTAIPTASQNPTDRKVLTMTMPANPREFNGVFEGRGWNSSLRALYDQWQRVRAAYDSLPDGCDVAENLLWVQLQEIEQYAENYVPQTMEDLVFKIIFADDGGDMSMNPHQVALARCAYAMAGMEAGVMGVAA